MIFSRSTKSSRDCPFAAFRSMRRTATVTMSVPERRWASAMTSLLGYLPVPTISVIRDFAADNRQDGSNVLDVLVGDREVVPVEYCNIGVVPDFNGAEVILLDEPFVCSRGKPERLRACQSLSSVDDIAHQV